MPDTELPRLTNAELAAMFGDDLAALQRYRMLAALIREGRPAAEVARAFGVSRESLRRLRRAFAREDVAALRSRKRGGGHFARGSPLARALRDELAVDPGAPAAALWVRVEARLGAQGVSAPRSTFYRLLTRLRAEEAEGADDESGRTADIMLREALGGLLEDPPVALGRSQLAELILADERDPQQRGRRMAQALQAAIAQMQPAADTDGDDPRWRHYRILAGEYIEGLDRAELELDLALSASTYSRAKREAIERLRGLLPSVIDALPAPPPPTNPDLDALRDAALDLAALLSPSMLRRMTDEQRDAALEALAPAEQLIAALRQGELG
jgi:transposase-like protein